MVEKNIEFLKIGSRLIKIMAWTFLFLGAASGIATMVSPQGNIPRWMGFYFIIIYLCGFLLVYYITLLGDLLIEVWQFLKKERF